MPDDEWKARRDRAVLAAFETGRPVFGDTDGELRFDDGDREPVPDDVGRDGKVIDDFAGEVQQPPSTPPTAKLSWRTRLWRWLGGGR